MRAAWRAGARSPAIGDGILRPAPSIADEPYVVRSDRASRKLRTAAAAYADARDRGLHERLDVRSGPTDGTDTLDDRSGIDRLSRTGMRICNGRAEAFRAYGNVNEPYLVLEADQDLQELFRSRAFARLLRVDTRSRRERACDSEHQNDQCTHMCRNV